jgi:hypothetical protein
VEAFTKGDGMSTGQLLLLGAGFSKNWGGRLASEVWADVFTNSAIQARDRVRKALLNERSFEAVMEDVLTGSGYDSEDRQAITKSVTDTFQRMDNLFAQKMILATDRLVNYATVKAFLSAFSGGFLFTLNQDTLLEQLLQQWTIPFRTPYVQQSGTANIPDARPTSVPTETPGITSVVKLHGSHTWRNSQGSPVMVIGENKSKTIAGSWLLTEYKSIFETVLNSGGVRLLVIGYSFEDEHINQAIGTATSSHQCKVFIWNPKHPLDMLDEKKQEQREILSGLIGWEPRLLRDVMPALGGGIRIPDALNDIFPGFFS